MITIHPVTLEGHGIRLEPLAFEHHDGLAVAAADGRLWELWFTAVPEPGADPGLHCRRARGPGGGAHAALGGTGVGERRDHRQHALSRHRRQRSIASRSATPGMPSAGNAATSTPAASCCCSATRSTRLGARWLVCAPTISTSPRSERSRPWAPRRMASSAITARAATARCATP